MAGRHNWNVGTMENWNNEFWETGTVVYWQNTMTRKLINEEFPYKIIIPTFQHSLAQTWHAKHEYKELIYEIL
jgi:hypothetical protein